MKLSIHIGLLQQLEKISDKVSKIELDRLDISDELQFKWNEGLDTLTEREREALLFDQFEEQGLVFDDDDARQKQIKELTPEELKEHDKKVLALQRALNRWTLEGFKSGIQLVLKTIEADVNGKETKEFNTLKRILN